MTVTVIPWFRDFLVEFLANETDRTLRSMGEAFGRQFQEDQWRTGQAFYVLNFLEAEIEALTANDTWQRIVSTKRKKAPVVPEPVVDLVKTLKDEVECPKGCIPANYAQHKDAVEHALDELQACLILAGGRKMSRQQLASMTLAEAMFMCLPNQIRIRASQIMLPRDRPLLT